MFRRLEGGLDDRYDRLKGYYLNFSYRRLQKKITESGPNLSSCHKPVTQ